MEHISEKEKFFNGAKVGINVGSTSLTIREMSDLRNDLSDKGIHLWAIISESEKTIETARLLGLATEIEEPNKSVEEVDPSYDTVMDGEKAVMIKRTLRSGFKVNFQGHVVVVGDVNPGAEIISSGSVIVWGKLRGMVHAGAEGDEGAMVCALDLAPTQLRIATSITVTPKRKGKTQPEKAFVKDGQIIAEFWIR